MQLESEDGTLLEVKEATVLSENGDVIVESPQSESHGKASSGAFAGSASFHVNGRPMAGWMIPLILLLGMVVLTAGAMFFVVFLLVGGVVALVRKLLR
jgi:hypothetical protein